MGRRTISNLSRELKVSRPRIYRALSRLNIEKKAGHEYPLDEWELLKKELASISSNSKEKKEDAKKIERANESVNESANEKADYGITNLIQLCDIKTSTLKERLNNAKQEYDYNRNLIIVFQEETNKFFLENKRTTVKSHNGSMSPLPSIVNLEKYIKLNIALSKLITELESDLDIAMEGDDDPFA